MGYARRSRSFRPGSPGTGLGRRLAKGCATAITPSFSNDGRWVYVACWVDSKLRVRRFAVDIAPALPPMLQVDQRSTVARSQHTAAGCRPGSHSPVCLCDG